MTARLSWSRESCPAQELPPTPAGAHIHHCGCGRYAFCPLPLDQCDEPDQCDICVDEQIAANRRPSSPSGAQA